MESRRGGTVEEADLSKEPDIVHFEALGGILGGGNGGLGGIAERWGEEDGAHLQRVAGWSERCGCGCKMCACV